MGKLDGRVAIVTGAAQGIGFAAASVFVQEGANVALIDVDAAKVEESARQAAALRPGAQTVGLKADVTSLPDCEAAAKAVVERWGKIDILLNNAGVTRDNLMMRMSEEDWDFVMSVNLKGAFHFTKAVIRPMLKAHYGRIINIASVVGEEGNPGQANYAASKGGLIALTKTLAQEFASRNILVNAIAPGFIRTRMTDAIPEAEKQKVLARIALGRMGEPQDVAWAALYLASEEARYVTGHVLNVNGGAYM